MIIGKQLQSPYYFVAVVSCHVDFMGGWRTGPARIHIG